MTALHVRCNALHKYGASRGPEGPTEAAERHTHEVPQPHSQSGITALQAEGEGFEPSKRLTTLNGFRDRPVQPLRHPSVSASGTRAERLAALGIGSCQ